MSGHVARQAVVGLLVLLGGSLVCDRLVASAAEAVVARSELRFSRAYAGGRAAEVLVLGNSRAVNAFYAPAIAERTKREVFHLGYNGMSMRVAEVLFDDYLARNEAPAFLLIEVTNLGVGDSLATLLLPYVDESPGLAALLGEVAPKVAVAQSLAHSFRYNGELFLRALYYLGRSDQAWINGGRIGARRVEALRAADEVTKNTLPVDGPGFAALERIVARCRKEGVQPSLLVSPYHPALVDNWPRLSADVARLQSALGERARVYDYSRALPDDAHFADPIHINRRGSLALLDKLLAGPLASLR